MPSPGRYLYDIGLRKTEKFKKCHLVSANDQEKFLSIRSILVGLCPESTEASCASRGTKTTVKTPEEEWIINKGMHEPIVSKELFDKVQDILSARQSEQGLATVYDSRVNEEVCSKEFFVAE